MTTTAIEVQDKLIAKISTARQFRSCAMIQSKARQQAMGELETLGFDHQQAFLMIQDAEDIEVLNHFAA